MKGFLRILNMYESVIIGFIAASVFVLWVIMTLIADLLGVIYGWLLVQMLRSKKNLKMFSFTKRRFKRDLERLWK